MFNQLECDVWPEQIILQARDRAATDGRSQGDKGRGGERADHEAQLCSQNDMFFGVCGCSKKYLPMSKGWL